MKKALYLAAVLIAAALLLISGCAARGAKRVSADRLKPMIRQQFDDLMISAWPSTGCLYPATTIVFHNYLKL